MKKCIVLLMVMFFLSASFTQEQSPVFNRGQLENKDMLVHASFLPGMYHYSSKPLSGGVISRKELYRVLLTIPENEKYVKRMKGWNIAEIISFGVFSGTAGYFLSCVNSGSLTEDKQNWCTAFMTLGFVYGALSVELRLANTVKAVDNYNLSIAGLPVIHR